MAEKTLKEQWDGMSRMAQDCCATLVGAFDDATMPTGIRALDFYKAMSDQDRLVVQSMLYGTLFLDEGDGSDA